MKVLSLLLVLVSCSLSKVDYKMPSTRFQTPEVTGGSLFQMEIKGRANVNYASSNRVTTASHLQDAIGPTDTNNLTVESAGQLGVKLDISVLDRLDLFWNLTIGSPAVGGFRWQWLGETEDKHARGWKGSITAGWGKSSSDPKIFPITTASLDEDYLIKNDMWVYDVSIQFGYRFNERFILYANGFFNAYNSDILMVPIDDEDNTEEDTELNLKSDNFGGILGVQYYFKNKVSFVNLEVGGSKATLSVDDVTNSDLALGVNFGWIFE
jgi:hypothetical protein